VARALRFPRALVAASAGLEALIDHPELGAHLIHEPAARRLYALDHLEASTAMFARALRRRHGADAAEAASGIRPGQPWRPYAQLLIADWLDQEVQRDASPPSSASGQPRPTQGGIDQPRAGA
jgi:homoserine trans-succinylase